MRAGTRIPKVPRLKVNTLELASELIARRSISPHDAGCLDILIEQLPRIYLQTLENLLIK